jgi:restriction system protein
MDSVRLLWEMAMGLVQLFVLLWPLTLVAVIILLFRIGAYLYRSYRLSKAGMADLDKLNGEDFERYLEILFKKLGYQVQRTPYQGDYGADLILRRGNEQISVQAKRYNRTVGVKAVQEAVTAKDYYSCNKAMVVTNSYFSRQARTLAKANNVELWDRNELVNRLLALKEEKPVPVPTTTAGPPITSMETSTENLEAPTVPIESASPVCAQCGKPVSIKVRDYCMDHVQLFGGRIYCYEHQKDVRKRPALT